MNRSVALLPRLSQLTAQLTAQLLVVGLALTSFLPGQAEPSFVAKHLQTVPKEYGLKEIFVYFGPNGKRCAYIAKSGVGFVMVVDGVAGKAHHYVDGLVFSADGKRYAHRTGDRLPSNKAERWRIIVDGQPQKEWSWIGSPAISPDGKEISYWAADEVELDRTGAYTDGDFYLLRNEKKKSEKFTNAIALFPPVYSGDSKHIASVGMRKHKWFVIYDKTTFGPYSSAGMPTLGKSKGIAWPGVGKRGVGEIMLGKKSHKGAYEAVGIPALSPNGKKLAFAAKKNGKLGIFVGKKQLGGAFTALGRPVFGPKGKKVAFCGATTGSDMLFGPTIEDMTQLIAMDGSHIRKWSLVVGGKQGKESYDGMADLVFGPKGKQVAFRAKIGDSWHCVVGKNKSEAYDQMTKPVFSTDGKRVAFGCRKDRELWWQVLELK